MTIRSLSLILAIPLVLVACGTPKVAKNPDPNHTHADFAVWIDGKQFDFNGPEFMSGSVDELDPDHTKHDKYLHLHDGNGHVIHRHKPGLSLKDFFVSLQVGFAQSCNSSRGNTPTSAVCNSHAFRLFVNGTEHPFNDFDYVFQDNDQILLTTSTGAAEIEHQLSLMTDDACLYSKICPERGDPPSENCIADPTVPCVGK